MNKGLKNALLIILGVFGAATMITPAFRALNSSSTSKIWTYSLYIRIFGGGSAKVGNTGLLTLAWILSLAALVVTVVLIILSIIDFEVSRKVNIITFSVIMVFYAVGGTLVIFAPQLIGNTTDAWLGIGSILTSCFMYAGFIMSLIFVLFYSLKKEN